MLQVLSNWLMSPYPLSPHGFCLLWEPSLILSFVAGDAGTGLAYFAIPVALAQFVRRRTDLVFKPIFWLFAVFILLCGTTHWLELATLWIPAYGLEAFLKLTTAIVSIASAIALFRLLPDMLALPSPAQMRTANEALTASEAQLRALNASLEARVAHRTEELQASEAKLRDLLATLDMGTFMTCDLDGTIRFWSDGCTQLYGWTAAEAVGRVCHELLQTQFPVPRNEVEAALVAEGAWSGDLRHTTRDGREVVVTARKLLRRDGLEQPKAVLEAMTDVTARRIAEQERQRADTLLRGIFEAASGMIYAKDLQGRILLANERVTQIIGKPWAAIEGKTDIEYLDDREQAAVVAANDRRIMENGCSEEVEELVGAENGHPRVWLSTKTPLRDGHGQVTGLVGISVEITERKKAEERLRLMVHELNHRVKNSLATVQSIATQTLRGLDPAIRHVLDGRLQSLAVAHDVLTRENWEGAELGEVVNVVLAPYGGRESERFEVSGPRMRLRPSAAISFAMAFHELVTNALKYGSLSPDAVAGRVALRWSLRDGELHLTWTESGGPPVQPATRRGFGTRLVERVLAQDLGGAVVLHFDPNGLICTVDTLLTNVAASVGAPQLLKVGGS